MCGYFTPRPFTSCLQLSCLASVPARPSCTSSLPSPSQDGLPGLHFPSQASSFLLGLVHHDSPWKKAARWMDGCHLRSGLGCMHQLPSELLGGKSLWKPNFSITVQKHSTVKLPGPSRDHISSNPLLRAGSVGSEAS